MPKYFASTGERLQKSFLLNDLEANVRKKGLTQSQHEVLKKQIAPSVIIRQIIQSYFLLAYARGLHQISLNSQFYEGMQNSYIGFFLSTSDPICLAPIALGFVTYKLLIQSNHPFTLKISENMCFWISFTTAILSVPLPVSYILAFSSFNLTHILLKKYKK